LDIAELLASLSVLVGAQRATQAALVVLGPEALATAAPLLQPLALSIATRRAIKANKDLLPQIRNALSEATGEPVEDLAKLQRIQPRTVLIVAALAGAFYFLLPQLANVNDSWRAFESADWSWLIVIVVMSALTYVSAAIGVLGTVPQHLPFGPTFMVQLGS